MSFVVGWRLVSREHRSEETSMTTTYTFDVFSSLDGFGGAGGDWTGYWGKQGPELLDRRLAVYDDDLHMVLGATTYRAFVEMLASRTQNRGLRDVREPWVPGMVQDDHVGRCRARGGPLEWPERGRFSCAVAPSDCRRAAQGSNPRMPAALPRQPLDEPRLMAAGTVDRVQVTLFR
jgi:hypothetical protein